VFQQTRSKRDDNAERQPKYPRSSHRLRNTTQYKMSSIRRSYNHFSERRIMPFNTRTGWPASHAKHCLRMSHSSLQIYRQLFIVLCLNLLYSITSVPCFLHHDQRSVIHSCAKTKSSSLGVGDYLLCHICGKCQETASRTGREDRTVGPRASCRNWTCSTNSACWV